MCRHHFNDWWTECLKMKWMSSYWFTWMIHWCFQVQWKNTRSTYEWHCNVWRKRNCIDGCTNAISSKIALTISDLNSVQKECMPIPIRWRQSSSGQPPTVWRTSDPSRAWHHIIENSFGVFWVGKATHQPHQKGCWMALGIWRRNNIFEVEDSNGNCTCIAVTRF